MNYKWLQILQVKEWCKYNSLQKCMMFVLILCEGLIVDIAPSHVKNNYFSVCQYENLLRYFL